ncbi:MAG: BACON domain-containing carbohydrate-binding protein [Proteiniphilum sp.]
MKRILKSFILCGLILFSSCDKEKPEQELYESLFSVPTQLNKINSAADGYTIPVEASDDISWSTSIPSGNDNDWITLMSMSGKGKGEAIFNLKANEGRNSRSIEVIFTASSDRSSNSIPPQKCVINQIGTDPTIMIDPTDIVTIPSTADPNYIITVTSNVEWIASLQINSGTEGWISITGPTGNPVTGMGEVKINILENSSIESREAVISITSTEIPGLKKTLTITQSGIIPTIEISPTGTEVISANANDSYMITVTSNIEWLPSIEIVSGDEPDWISIISPIGTFTGSGSITLNIKANNDVATRTATLHVKSVDFPTDNNLIKTLTITQINAGAMSTIFISDYFTLTTGEAVMNISPYPSGTAQNLVVDVTSDISGATIEFIPSLSTGNYLVNSLTYNGNPSINIGAVITIDAAGMVTFVEHWDVSFQRFGGSLTERPIAINSLTDLNTLRTAVNNGNNYAGIIFKQTDNISLNGDWNPIGNAVTNPFSGIYDGNNFKISNLYVSGGTNKAFFGAIGGINADSVAIIKNLTIEGSGGASADITGNNGGVVAGVVAVVTANTLIENCINHANITAPGGSNVGGIASTCTGDNITIILCKNYGKILGATGNSGGIAANLTSTDSQNIYITSCHNYGDLDIASAGSSVTGGIIGRVNNPTRAEIKWCSNRGNIIIPVNSTSGTGGIIGALVGNTVIRECYNLGSITTRTNSGGISGLMNNNAAIYNCYNKGDIEYGTSTAVNNSGIAGNMTNAKSRPIEYCYNVGSATTIGTGNQNYGGIAASNGLTAHTDLTAVKECFYESGKGYAGGIGGNLYPPNDVTDRAEGKTTAEMQTATPYTANWDTSIWQFSAGHYPTLKNNPE